MPPMMDREEMDPTKKKNAASQGEALASAGTANAYTDPRASMTNIPEILPAGTTYQAPSARGPETRMPAPPPPMDRPSMDRAPDISKVGPPMGPTGFPGGMGPRMRPSGPGRYRSPLGWRRPGGPVPNTMPQTTMPSPFDMAMGGGSMPYAQPPAGYNPLLSRVSQQAFAGGHPEFGI
jgi:hypothetical protein